MFQPGLTFVCASATPAASDRRQHQSEDRPRDAALIGS